MRILEKAGKSFDPIRFNFDIYIFFLKRNNKGAIKETYPSLTALRTLFGY